MRPFPFLFALVWASLCMLSLAGPASGQTPSPPTLEIIAPATLEASFTPADAQLEALQWKLAEADARLLEAEGRLDQAEARLDEIEAVESDLALRALPASPQAGASVIEAGEVVPEAVSFAGPLEVHGRIQGAAVAFGGDVHIYNGAHVEGDAVSFGGRVLVDEGGAVDGDRVTIGDFDISRSAVGSISTLSTTHDHPSWVRALAHRLVLLLSFAGVGVMVVGLFPRQVDNVAQTLASHPIRSGLVGVVVSGLATILMVVFTITLIGIPVTFLIAGVMTAAWLLGFIGLCQAAGDRLPLSNQGARRWLAFLLGVLAMAFLTSLPLIGQLLLVVMGFACVGAAIQSRLGNQELVD